MGSGNSGLYSGTHGATVSALNISSNYPSITERPLFLDGHVTARSLSKYREEFSGKTVSQINKMLRDEGYETKIRKSVHASSKAKVIVTTNNNKDRNISQIQVSPGSPRHGNIPYVKISTTDHGVFKIIDGKKSDYKTDGKESATLYFTRRSKKK